MSSSKIYLNPSTFFHTHVHHTNPSSCHLLPEWLISLTRFPASILASTTIRYHTVARVTEHIIPLFRCLKPSNDFLLLSEKKMKSHYSCLPLRSHLIPLMSLTELQTHWLFLFLKNSKLFLTCGLYTCYILCLECFHATVFLITEISLLQWNPISSTSIK